MKNSQEKNPPNFADGVAQWLLNQFSYAIAQTMQPQRNFNDLDQTSNIKISFTNDLGDKKCNH